MPRHPIVLSHALTVPSSFLCCYLFRVVWAIYRNCKQSPDWVLITMRRYVSYVGGWVGGLSSDPSDVERKVVIEAK
jgi:hypothetical protein